MTGQTQAGRLLTPQVHEDGRGRCRGGGQRDDARRDDSSEDQPASRPGRDPRERQDPHDEREALHRVLGGDQGRALHRGRDRTPERSRWKKDPRHRSARPHRGAGHHRQPQPHRADGQPPRLPHAARERAFDRRRSGHLCRARERRAARARGSRPSAASTPISSSHPRTRPPRFPTLAELDRRRRTIRSALRRLQRSVGHQHRRARKSSTARRRRSP